ncbi:MAG: recombinase zinc beta ribbon domain-containing protein [Polyangiaceae bacterium]|nr:recombinase zinc beta ribbon domain-containing protein [Polyangiaceae bacterium]
MIWETERTKASTAAAPRSARPDSSPSGSWSRSLSFASSTTTSGSGRTPAAAPSSASEGSGAGARPKYLLSGFARCGLCGGPITVANGKAGTVPIRVYTCAYHRDRGEAVCGNKLRRPVDAVDEQPIGWLQENVLSERIMSLPFMSFEPA